MRNYLFWPLLLFVFSFTGCTSLGKITNPGGYEITDGFQSANFSNHPEYRARNQDPVYCAGQRAYTIPVRPENIYCRPTDVWVEKDASKKKRYFWVSMDGVKNYIPTDKIYTESEAHNIFFALGGTTGVGNLTSRSYIKSEELSRERKIRSIPISNWKNEVPYLYEIILLSLSNWGKQWDQFDDDVKIWFAKIIKEENLKGYDAILAYVDKL